MEALDKAIARNKLRMGPEILDAVKIHNVDDIKRVLKELDPKSNDISETVALHAVLQTVTVDGPTSYNVSANTKSRSKRDMLLDGMSIIKKRMETSLKSSNARSVEINGREMKPIGIASGEKAATWVDPLIRRWLGAYRDCLTICWNIGDGWVYQYCIFTHKLTREVASTKDVK